MKRFGEEDISSIHNYKKIISGLLMVCAIGILILAVFGILDKLDNKYSHFSAQPVKGVLTIDGDTFANGSYLCPIDDWEFYNETLYYSGSGERVKPRYIFIGQYSDYSMRQKNESAFGSASYRLKIVNLGDPVILSMEVPELFSSSRIYINGKSVAELGDLDKDTYRGVVQNQVVSFEAGKETELVLEITNYEHYYSGMFYPVILGTTGTVTGIVFARLIVYGILCIAALTMALFSLVVWRNGNKKIYVLYGVLCLAYGIHVSYPFVRWIGVLNVNFLYALEDSSEYIMIACAAAISALVAGEDKKLYFKKGMLPLCIGMCLFSFFVPLLILTKAPSLNGIYGSVIDGYQIFISCYMLLMAFKGILLGKRGFYLMLAGNVIYGIGILWDVFTSNLFEPVRGAWPKEYAGFCLIIVFSVMLQFYIREIQEENERLTRHLEQEVNVRTRELTGLLHERKKLLSEVAHDLKAPVSSIQTFIEFMKISNVRIDDETRAYLTAIEQKSEEVQSRVANLQELSVDDRIIFKKKRQLLNNFLQQLYENHLPDAQAYGIYFNISLPEQKIYMELDENLLARAFGNIIYNAFDFTPFEGKIHIRMDIKKEIRITISDTGKGVAPEDLPHIFEANYSKRASGEPKGKGLGLHIAKAIIDGHGGWIEAESHLGNGTTFTIYFNVRQRGKSHE